MLDRPRRTAVVLVMLFAGCSWRDPFCETAHVPYRPSATYSPTYAFVADATATALPDEFEGRTLSLAECILTALERNPQTRIAWQASRSSAFQVGQERSSYLPQVDLTGALSHSELLEDRKKAESPRNAVNAMFGVRYLLLDGGLRNARVRSAEAELAAANFQHNTALQDVAVAVELAYHQRLAAKALVDVAEKNVRQSEYNLELARARQRSGVAAKFDVLTAETEKANADLALVRARNTQRIAQGQLANRMGLQVSQVFDIEELPQDVHQEELADIEHLLEEAAQARPELQAALAAIAARGADADAIGAEYFPQVSANADYGFRDELFLPSGDEWTVGLGLELPLFAGFSRTYRQAQAWSEYEAAAAQYENDLRGVELEVWTAHSRLIEAGEAIEAAKKLVASADESLRVATGRYQAGAGNIIELVGAQTAQTDAHNQHVRAVLSWYTALAQFQRTIGRTLAESGWAAEDEAGAGEP
ncbi:MAG: TolC family protein [Planctomycetes bacterium]|nr:TolC family protein [Planctomycetota bacterium]